MKIDYKFIHLVGLFVLITTINITAQSVRPIRCSTHEVDMALQRKDPEYKLQRQLMTQQLKKLPKSAARLSGSGGNIIVIPVVFHVIHNNDIKNISDAQIKAQIQQLNDDYRRVNTDRGNTPSVFQGVGSDMEVQFCLAARTPAGAISDGITRHVFSNTVFTDATFDATVKPSTKWDATKYLNIWTANIESGDGSGLLGYATFPRASGPTATDGVVLNYATVGSITTPGIEPRYNLGRTAAHEVGHWLSLFHIWGDDQDETNRCIGTDYIDDTPDQGAESGGCPPFPKTDVCSPNASGAMFMNYMDYTDDACMNVFTQGQKEVMLATLNGPRLSILSSNGCTPPTGTPDYCINANLGTQPTCIGGSLNYVITSTALNGFTGNITLTTEGVPTDCTTNFSASTVSIGNNSGLTLNVGGAVTAGFYNLTVKATNGSLVKTMPLTFRVLPNALSAPTLTTPAASTGQSVTPSFFWATVAGATSYDLQVSVNADFSTILSSQTNLTETFGFIPTGSPLLNNTTYHWRVRPKNSCTTGSYVSSSFTTGSITCQTFSSTNVPRTISSSGTPEVTSNLTVTGGGTLTDVNIVNLRGTHTYIADLGFSITSPSGSQKVFASEMCDNRNDFNIQFDEQAALAYGSFPCPPTNSGFYGTLKPLTPLNGINPNGTWTLTINDFVNGDGGSLTAWGLRVCANNAVLPIELLSFKAHALDDKVKLTWATAQEKNNRGFDIQRTTDPLSIFTPIGFVKGQGNSSQTVDYQWLDSAVKPGVTYYYRLRQLDFDGTETYSNVEAVNWATAKTGDVVLYPNPVKEELRFELLGKTEKTADVEIYAADGKIMMLKTVTFDNAQGVLSLQNIPDGLYFVKCRIENTVFTKKIIKNSTRY